MRSGGHDVRRVPAKLRRLRAVVLVFLVVFALSACAKERSAAPAAIAASSPMESAQRAAPASEAAPVEPAAAPKRVDERKLIKTVGLRLEVKDTTAAAEAIKQLTTSLGGYVSSLSAHKAGELLYYQIAIRVPVEQLESAVGQMKTLASEVEGETVQTQDVTDQFVDLEARLKALKATEEELLALLAESRKRNQSAKDIMAIYEELTGIRTRIEQIQGQLRLLDNQASLSTINIELIPTEAAKPIVVRGWSPMDAVRASTRTLVRTLQSLADFAIGAIIVLLPLALILGVPIVLLVRALRRRRARRREDSGSPDGPTG